MSLDPCLPQLQSSCWLGLWSPLKTSKSSWLLAEVASSRAFVLRALGLPLLSASLSSLPQGLSRAAPNITSGFQQHEQAEEQERASKMESESFCNLISEVTSHQLCHPLAARSESLGLAHTQGKEITPGCEYQEVEIFGGDLGGCCPACGRMRWRHLSGTWTAEVEALGRYLGWRYRSGN